MTTHQRAWRAAMLACFVAACGGDNGPASPPPGTDAPITGTEQLGWTQAAASAADVSTLQFGIYVDDARQDLPWASCGSVVGGSAECRSPLPALTPGQHRLELVAVRVFGDQRIESARSAALVVTVAAGQATSSSSLREPPSDTPSTPRTRSSTRSCGLSMNGAGTTYVAWSSGRIESVAADGAHRALDWQPPSGPGLVLRSVAVHPDYDANHWLYVVLTGPSRLVLARYRELAGVLGEAAVLFEQNTNLPLDRPALRFGPDRRLYIVLLDAVATDHDPAPRPFVIRLNDDGSVPRENRSRSPQLDLRAAAPAAMTWDPTGDPWVLEAAHEGSRLRRLAERDGEPLAISNAVSMAFVPRGPDGGPFDLWVVRRDGRIDRIEGGGVRPFREGRPHVRVGDAIAAPNQIVTCGAQPEPVTRYLLAAATSRASSR